MNDLTLLRTLRDDVAEPDAERLAPAYAKLERAMHPPVKRPAPRSRWALAGIGAAAAAAIVVAGIVSPRPEAASAATVLREAAASAITYSDPVAAPGQYTKFHIKAQWASFEISNGGEKRLPQDVRVIDLYVPADAGAEWVLYRDWGDQRGFNGQREETRRGVNGDFGKEYDHRWMQPVDKIPTGSGSDTLAYFDAQYQGGSASRDEDDWTRITDILRYQPVSSTLRARLFEALALISGAVSTDGVKNLDGQTGVAISRTESNRQNELQEIIIDPTTGQVIGDRTTQGDGTVIALTAISTTVVDKAP